MGEYLLDHHRVFDADNDPDGAAACPADLDVNVKHTLEPLRLGDRCPALHGSARNVGGANIQRNDRIPLG